MNSRSKGKRGELEASKEWARVLGGSCRRGQQFAGGTDSPDIVTDHTGIHVEVKRTEKGNPYAWITQAVTDADGKVPVVLHRRNGKEWLLIVRFADVPRLAEELTAKVETLGRQSLPNPVSGEGLPQTGEVDGELPGVLPIQ